MLGVLSRVKCRGRGLRVGACGATPDPHHPSPCHSGASPFCVGKHDEPPKASFFEGNGRSRGRIVEQNVSLKTFFHRPRWVFPIFVKKRGIEVGQNSRWQSETTPTPHPRLSLVAPPPSPLPASSPLVPLPTHHPPKSRRGQLFAGMLLRPSSRLDGRLSRISASRLFLGQALFGNSGKGRRRWRQRAKDQTRVRITGEVRRTRRHAEPPPRRKGGGGRKRGGQKCLHRA